MENVDNGNNTVPPAATIQSLQDILERAIRSMQDDKKKVLSPEQSKSSKIGTKVKLANTGFDGSKAIIDKLVEPPMDNKKKDDEIVKIHPVVKDDIVTPEHTITSTPTITMQNLLDAILGIRGDNAALLDFSCNMDRSIEAKKNKPCSTRETVIPTLFSSKSTLVKTYDTDSSTVASTTTAEASIDDAVTLHQELSPVKNLIATIEKKIKENRKNQQVLSPVATKSNDNISDQANFVLDIVEEDAIVTAEGHLVVTCDNNNVANDRKDNDSEDSSDIDSSPNFQLANKIVNIINASTMRDIMAMIMSKQMLGSLLI